MGVIVSLSGAGFRPIRRKRALERAEAPSVAIRRRSLARNAPLHCLAGAALAAHFHKWRGASGQRYICSVFPVRAGEELGGLPEFDHAVALAVARGADGERQRTAVFDLCWRDGQFYGDPEGIKAALRSGANEWHIHLLADGESARQAVIADLSV